MGLPFIFTGLSLWLAVLFQVTLGVSLPYLNAPPNFLLVTGGALLLVIPRLWVFVLALFFSYGLDCFIHSGIYHFVASLLALMPVYFFAKAREEQKWGLLQMVFLNVLITLIYEVILGGLFLIDQPLITLRYLLSYLPALLIYQSLLGVMLGLGYSLIIPRLQYRKFQFGTRPLSLEG